MDQSGFAAAENVLTSKQLSVAALCREAGVAPSTWNRLRAARHRGRAATLGQLRRAFLDLTGQEWPVPPAGREAA
jgi:transposase-like protein